jgi:hypothetical protein
LEQTCGEVTVNFSHEGTLPASAQITRLNSPIVRLQYKLLGLIHCKSHSLQGKRDFSGISRRSKLNFRNGRTHKEYSNDSLPISEGREPLRFGAVPSNLNLYLNLIKPKIKHAFSAIMKKEHRS